MNYKVGDCYYRTHDWYKNECRKITKIEEENKRVYFISSRKYDSWNAFYEVEGDKSRLATQAEIEREFGKITFPEDNWGVDVKDESKEARKQAADYIQSLRPEFPQGWSGDGSYYFINNGKINCNTIKPDVKIYTYQEFKSIKDQNNQIKTMKIIGYKVPMDMFNGEIKAGTIYENLESMSIPGTCFVKDSVLACNVKYNLPKEIVETWEPVYEGDIKVGDWVVLIKRGAVANELSDYASNLALSTAYQVTYTGQNGVGGTVQQCIQVNKNGYYIPVVKFRKATEAEVKQATEIKFSNYVAEKNNATSVKFGCQVITLEELNAVRIVLNLDEKLHGSFRLVDNLNGTIRISVIDKLLNMLK